MSTVAPPSKPINPVLVDSEHYIDEQIRRTRRSLKLVDLAAGVITLLIGLLGFVLTAAVIDHWVVPGGLNTAGRTALFIAFLAGAAWYGWRQFIPLLRPINPVYAAHTIERGAPTLKNSLLNLLLFRTHRVGMSARVYHALEQQTALRLSSTPIDNSIDHAGLLRLGWALLLIVAVGAVYAVLSPKDVIASAGRVLAPWADIAPPSRVKILDIKPGDLSVARGERVPISAEIHGLRNDERVRVRFTSVDERLDDAVSMAPAEVGRRYEATLPRSGDGPAAEAGVMQDMYYWIEAGDARSNRYRLSVFNRPTIIVQKVRYEHPAYTGYPSKDVDSTGDIRGIEGTKVTISGLASQPIKSAYVDFNADGTNDQKMIVDGDRATATFTLALREDRRTPLHTHYMLRFTCTENRTNTDPPVYRIEVTPDYAPEISITKPEEPERTVMLDERVVIGVEARDPDFALSQVRLVGKVGDRDIAIADLLGANKESRVRRDVQFTPADARLKPGDVLEYWAEAVDNKSPEPNEQRTERRRLKIAGLAEQPKNGKQQPGEKGQQGQQEQQGQQGEQNGQGQQHGQGQAGEQQGQQGANQQGPNQQGQNGQGQGQPQGDNAGEAGQQQGQGGGRAGENNGQGQDAQQQPAGGGAGGTNESGQPNQQRDPQNGNASGGNTAGERQQQQQQEEQQQNGQMKPGDASAAAQQGQPQAGQRSGEPQQGGQRHQQPGQRQNAQQQGQSQGQGQPQQQGNQQGGGQQQQQGQGAGQQQQQQQKVSSDGSDDRSAFEKISDFLKGKQGDQQQQQQPGDDAQRQANGQQQQGDRQQQGEQRPQGDQNQAGEAQQSGAQQPGDQAQQQPGGEQGQPGQSGGDPQAQQGAQGAQPQAQKSSGAQQPNAGQSQPDKPSGAAGQRKNQLQQKPPADGASEEQVSENAADAQQQTEAGDNASQRQGADTPRQTQNGDGNPGQQQGAKEPPPDSGMNRNDGNTGSGHSTDEQEGSPAHESFKQGRQKDDVDNRKAMNDEEPPGGSPDKKESNSRGGKSGEQTGGGQEGAGQKADAPGKGDAGQHEAADDGAGRADEQGRGKTGTDAGRQQTADGKTGESSSDRPGAGTDQRETSGDRGQARSADEEQGESPQRENERQNGQQQQSPNASGKRAPQASPQQQGERSQQNQTSNDQAEQAGNQQAPSGEPGQPQQQSGQKPDQQPSEPQGSPQTAGSSQPQGGGRSGSNAMSAPQASSEQEEADKANLEYARKQTSLVLERLEDQLAKKQVDQDMLKSLGWTEDELRRFVERWKHLKQQAANNLQDPEAQRELDNALRSLGLRPQGQTRVRARAEADKFRDLNEGVRKSTPIEYADRVREFQKSIAERQTERPTD